MRFKHYFHTVMGQLIDNNIVLAPVDKEANRLGLIEMGFLPGAKTQQNIVSGDIIARLGKTSTDIWPEDLYTLFASKEPSQELFHRILKELLFPIFITKTNPDSEETVFEMQHNTYEREFIAGDLRRDRNPRFNRLLPLIEGFCAVADPTQLIANTEQFAEIINQFSVQIIGYYYPPNSLLATQRAIDSDLIELALFLINTQKNFAPGDATAQEALNKLCAPILKKLVFYQYTSTQLYTSPINPNSQASPELMASFLDALGVDMYLYFIHSWVKDVKILPECEEIDLNAASKVQQLPFPNVKLFNEAVTVLITGYIELKNTVDSISEIDSIERQSLSRKMKVVYQSIEALFFRTTAICDANSLTRHHTYALSNFFNVCILRSPNPHLDSNRREQVLRQLIAFEKSSVTVEQLLAEHELVPQWLKVSTFLALFNLDSQQFPKCTQLPVAIKTFQRTQNALAFSRPNRQNVHTASENITARESADKLIAQYMTDPVNQNTLFTLEDALFKELEISILRTLENLSIEEQNKLLLQTMPDYMSSSISAFFQGPTGSTPAQREGYCKTLLNLYGIYAQDRYKLPNASATMESAYRTLVGFNYARSLTTPISGYSFTIPTLLHVVVLAIDDFKTYKDSHPTETDDEIQKMIQGLHQQLRIALRELIISYQEITPPIPSEVYCQDGVVKRILQILDKIHPSVQLFCFDTETLRGILTETVDTTFASLPYDEQQQIIMSVEAEIAPFQTSTQDGLLKSQLYSAVIPVELMRQVKPAYLTAQTSQQLTLEAAIEKGLLDRALVESYFPNPESSRAEIEVPLIGCQRIILYWQLMQILRKAPSITWQGLKPMLLEIRDKINGILTESDNGITLFGDHFDFLENAFTRYNEQIKSKPSPSSPKSTAPTVAQIGVFGARPKRIQEREDEEPTMKRPRKIDEQLPKEKEEKRRAEEDLPEDELEKRGKRFR